MFDPLAIALSLFSPNFQKLRYFLIPSINMDSFSFAEVDKPTDFEHVIFRLEAICNDMRSQGNHFYSFELTAYLPTDVVNPELQPLWRVQKQQHT